VATAAIEDLEVAEVARRVTGDPAAELVDWAATPIAHVRIIDTTGGLHVVGGRVRCSGTEVPFTCVLKVLTRPADGDPDPASWAYWRREAAFYASTVAPTLPRALRAPGAYGVWEEEHVARVWMEHVPGHPGPWSREDFARAARASGRSAGEFVCGRPLPDEPWLARGFLRSILADGDVWHGMMTGAAWASPLAAPFRGATRERVMRLWADRDALLAVADRLPQVLGHGDLHPRNILLPPDGEDIVAVDWGFCGPAPLGADLGDLVRSPAWFCDIEVDAIPAVEAAALAAYEDGLRDAGWVGDPRLVRLGYGLHVALRAATCIPGWASFMLGPERAASSEVLYGRPVEAILDAWVALEARCLDLADETRALARELRLA
jgi:hypothetical protein